MEYAQVCAESCEAHGLPYEFIEAVEFIPCGLAFASVGARMIEGYKNTMGNCGCHASMIKCWARIVELGHPCIILEHDAIIVGDVTKIDIPDMAVVTFGHRVAEKNDYVPHERAKSLIRISRAVGAHAYGISPETAQWLHKDACTKGVGVGVDRLLMMEPRLPLFVCEPPQAVCWVRIPTTNFTEEEANQEPTEISMLHRYQEAFSNYAEALTPGWYKGFQT